jgi:hypothetical protein
MEAVQNHVFLKNGPYVCLIVYLESVQKSVVIMTEQPIYVNVRGYFFTCRCFGGY